MAVIRSGAPLGALVSLAVTCALPGVGYASEEKGQIAGLVVASIRTPLATATVTIADQDGKVVEVLRSGKDGFFGPSALIPGKYTVTVELEGYQKHVRKGVRVAPGGSLTDEFKLEPSVDGEGERFRAWISGGVGYLNTQANFAKPFPEFRVSTDLHVFTHKAFVIRVFAETGLSSTSSLPAPSPSPSPSPAPSPRPSSNLFAGSKTIDNSIGVGIGGLFGKPFDEAFAVLLVARLGVKSLEETNEQGERLPFQSAFGLRIENPSGGRFWRYAGSYIEAGWGQSDQYPKRNGRLKIDVLLRLRFRSGDEPDETEGGEAAHLTIRVQTDRVRPGYDFPQPSGPTDPPLDLERLRAGDAKLSLLISLSPAKLVDVVRSLFQ